MAHMTITFDIDNAAFEDTSDGEYRRIFAKISHQLARNHETGNILDVNGNLIGGWAIAEGEYEEMPHQR
jgi:hypothetical protein